jgi:hypothetical protein
VNQYDLNSIDLTDFFSTISEGKRETKSHLESLVGDSFDNLFLSALTEDVKPKLKKIKKRSPKQIIKEDTIVDSSVKFISETNFTEPPSVKNSDLLTPLNQNFVTLDQLQQHYKLFLNRVQQQLSTLGGGGETNLTYMDVPVTSVTSSSYTISHKDYYVGVNYAGPVSITLPKVDKNGKIFIVKDELGQASAGINRYITIFSQPSDLIDGKSSAIIGYDYGSLTFIWKGDSWRII